MTNHIEDIDVDALLKEAEPKQTITPHGVAPTAPSARILEQPIQREEQAVPAWMEDDGTAALQALQMSEQADAANASAVATTENYTGADLPKVEIHIDNASPDATTRFVNEDEKVDLAALSESEKILSSILGELLPEDAQKIRAQEAMEAKKNVKIVIPLSSASTIAKSLVKQGMQMGSEPFRDAFSDNDSVPSVCRDAMEHFSAQTTLCNQALEMMKAALSEQTGELANLNSILQKNIDNVGVTTTRGLPNSLGKKKVLSGKEAVVTVASMMQGIKRIPLWNSGIYITLRALSLKEITAFFNTVNTAGYEYGRELGGYYFMYVDHTIKKLVFEQLLPYALVDCNYKHWRNVKKLLNVISLHDYDLILWAFASMMYRDGVPIKILCTNDECSHVDEIMGDLTKMRFVDASKITPEALAIMKKTDVKTDRDLQEYHKALGLTDTFKYKVENRATDTTTYWHFKLKVANCAEYLECGSQFNNELFEYMQNPTKEDATAFLTVNYYKAFMPWIVSLECVTEEGFDKTPCPDDHVLAIIDGTLTDNREALSSILDISQMETNDFAQYVTDFIKKSRITHIAIQHNKCVNCDAVPETAVDGFIPYDVQAHFFMMCLMRMLKAA